jgi:hypothetical protein
LRFEEQAKRELGRGLRRADFAKRIVVSQSHLSAVEHGCNEVCKNKLDDLMSGGFASDHLPLEAGHKIGVKYGCVPAPNLSAVDG